MESASQGAARGASDLTHYGEDYLRYQVTKGAFRRWVRGFYVRRAVKRCIGPTLDFGCGPGVNLAKMPAGSVGLDVNRYAVEHCRGQGLTAHVFEPAIDGMRLGQIEGLGLKTFFCAHVLEHLEDPLFTAKAMCDAAKRTGARRLVFIVPGIAGFKSDTSHRTLIDEAFFKRLEVEVFGRFRIAEISWFPSPLAFVGRFFVYEELMVVFDAVVKA